MDRRLYLFDGTTFIHVPESAWLTELKSNPSGIAALKAVEEPFIFKGWIKLGQIIDPLSHAVSTDWFFEETGARTKVVVDKQGNISVNGNQIGQTPIAEAHTKLEQMASNVGDGTGRWVTITHAAKDEFGNAISVKRPIFMPEKSQLQAGKDARKPETISKPKQKGGPHQTVDVMTSWSSMKQSIGTYEPVLTKQRATRVEVLQALQEAIKTRGSNTESVRETAKQAFSALPRLYAEKAVNPEDIIHACNLMLDLAVQEPNEEEQEALCREVEEILNCIKTPPNKGS